MTARRTLPSRHDVVGTSLSHTSYEEVLGLLTEPPSDRARTIAVCNVHSVMAARQDPKLRRALQEADVATTDGMPLVWAMRTLHGLPQHRVYGPDIMRRAFEQGASGIRHFLYGSTEETLEQLVSQLRLLAPEAEISGWYSPPFRELTDEELDEHGRLIRDSGATVVWVGLGMPKQELWMHRMASRLEETTLVGVGAAFDFLAGRVRQAPRWMQRSSLEWLFRLKEEPRRLWCRYAIFNPLFLGHLSLAILAKSMASMRRLAR